MPQPVRRQPGSVPMMRMAVPLIWNPIPDSFLTRLRVVQPLSRPKGRRAILGWQSVHAALPVSHTFRRGGPMATETPTDELGLKAPAFSLPGTDGKSYSLADVKGERGTL